MATWVSARSLLNSEVASASWRSALWLKANSDSPTAPTRNTTSVATSSRSRLAARRSEAIDRRSSVIERCSSSISRRSRSCSAWLRASCSAMLATR